MARPYEKSPPREIACEDCGAPRLVRRSDARLCEGCAAIHQLTWARSGRRKSARCRVCDVRFRPIHRTDIYLCGRCCPIKKSWVFGAPCVWCDGRIKRDAAAGLPVEHKRVWPQPFAGIAICVRCAKDYREQTRILAALQKAADKRGLDNGLSTPSSA